MKKIFPIMFSMLIISVSACAQTATVKVTGTESEVAATVDKLFKAFIDTDKAVLEDITIDELVYAHSGGKVQNKTEFIAEIMSKNPLIYLKIVPEAQTIKLSGNTAVVRHIFTAETTKSDGSPGTLRVGNTLAFKLQDGKWKLMLRQAYRLPE